MLTFGNPAILPLRNAKSVTPLPKKQERRLSFTTFLSKRGCLVPDKVGIAQRVPLLFLGEEKGEVVAQHYPLLFQERAG